VGFALLDSANSHDSADVTIQDRDGKSCPVELVKLPFYDVDKHIPRGLPSTDDIPD
jgi:glycine cleavage system aminomethyltransferase T